MDYLITGPDSAGITFLFAHGAGAPMDSDFMNRIADGLSARGIRVVRFEFPYMARRRVDGKKPGPNRAPILLDTLRQAVADHGGPDKVFVGGKSMGGRIATMIAAEAKLPGCVVFGYPFHAPGKPDQPRIDHLAAPQSPILILHGTRDPFGSPAEIGTYAMGDEVSVRFIEDGDHSLEPRKKSGRTTEQNWTEAIEAAAEFCRR